MFTDEPVTPVRLETLLDLMRNTTSRKVDRRMLIEMLQPDGLVNMDTDRVQAKRTIKAASELGLMKKEDEDTYARLTFNRKDERTTRQIVLGAIDSIVLSDTRVEPYFALFYSYLLSLNAEGVIKKTNDEWARDFERYVQGGQRSDNPFNKDKLAGLYRWMTYAGLGWFDANEVFQPNPYERLQRSLTMIFAGETKLTGEAFMQRMAVVCPELDGGVIFQQACGSRSDYKETHVCTLGLSHALIDLHQDDIIRLYCPRDSRGWSIEAAEPPSDESLQSARIDTIELAKVT
jgi:hypothetical protein